MRQYTATTTNSQDKVTATATDPAATIKIKKGSTAVTNGGNASWSVGSNTLTITVSGGAPNTVYTVTVTRTEQEE